MQKIEGLRLALGTLFRSHTKLPHMVQFAINSDCNMTCQMCPRKIIKIPEYQIPLLSAKEIIDKLEGVKRIALVGLGEPFLHPDLFEIIKYCKGKEMYTQVTTNGTLLRKEILHELINTGLDNLAVSIESIDNESKLGHTSNSVIENIEQFIEYKKRIGATKPNITIQVVLISEVVEEIKKIVEWSNNVGVEHVNISRANVILDPEMKRPSREEEKIFFKQLHYLRKKYQIRIDCMQDQIYPGFLGRLYKYILPLARLDSWCLKWSYYTYILENGNVVPCSGFYPRKTIFGNIYENSLKEIWNGKLYRALRKSKATWKPCKYCDNLRINQRKSMGVDSFD